MLPHARLLPATSTSTGAVKEAGQTLVQVLSPFLSSLPLLCIPFRAQLPAWLGAPTQRGVRSSIQPLQGHSTELTPLLGHTIVAGMAESTKHLYNLSLISITFSELLRAVLSALHPVVHYGFEHLLQWPSFLGHIFRGLTTCLIISPLQT